MQKQEGLPASLSPVFSPRQQLFSFLYIYQPALKQNDFCLSYLSTKL